jgi:hypothetical protein
MGPTVLKDVVSKKFYHHFMSISVAMSSLLNSDDDRIRYYLDDAKQLLVHFVEMRRVSMVIHLWCTMYMVSLTWQMILHFTTNQ